MAESQFISIVICTYNRADYLRDTLLSLLGTKALASQFEVLVIDNNSSDETPETVQHIIESHAQYTIKYITESKQGLSYARNCGINEASANVLLFLDDDIRAHPDFIPAWLSFFDNYPKAAGGGGKIHVQFDDPRPKWMSHFLLPLLGHHNLGNRIKKYPANKYPFGGNMAFRRTIFEQYGTFHTDLGRKGSQLMASEEKEFYNRFSDDEEIYYLPDSKLYHRVDEKRLTRNYLKKQALGLGKSIALQTENASPIQKGKQLGSELLKILATIILSVGYSVTFQFSKAAMLIRFRRWIWEGYRSQKAGDTL